MQKAIREDVIKDALENTRSVLIGDMKYITKQYGDKLILESAQTLAALNTLCKDPEFMYRFAVQLNICMQTTD